MEVAREIISQLGGPRFAAMTGAKKFTALNDMLGGVTFRLPSNFAKHNINNITIVLHYSDTYIVTFKRASKVISTHSNIYCDDLVALFERETGLYTHL